MTQEMLDTVINETIAEAEQTEEGRKAIAWHKAQAARSETDFMQYMRFRTLRFYAERKARTWIAAREEKQ